MKRKSEKVMARNNRGFSLIEVLLAIVILALVATPIYQIFTTSLKMNNRSREVLAATDVATITMEYLSSMRMDMDDGIRDLFQNPASVTRIPGLSYTATAVNLNTNYSSAQTFSNKMVTDLNSYQNACVYYNETSADSGVFGMALNKVEHNNYVFDVIVWFEPVNGGEEFFTYDVTVEVYGTDSTYVANGSGGSTVSVTHYDELLIVLNGAVMNK